jgi:HicB_like antitoxin of bacterial toxin-antitoxin system
MENAKEAIELWLEVAIDDGMAVPEPLAEHQRKREFKVWTWGLVTIDIASLSDKAERINITLPSRVLRRMGQAAKAAGESRSGYIARRALN